MRVELVKRADGRYVLRCTRSDGSVTWQTQAPPNARFFPFHDLTHYAVETTLGFEHGFFGLVAAGWDIVETGGKGARGAIPREAVLVEHLVGIFDRERDGTMAPLTPAEVDEQLAMRAAEGRFPLPAPFTVERLERVRAAIADLHARWRALAPDAALELEFPPAA